MLCARQALKLPTLSSSKPVSQQQIVIDMSYSSAAFVVCLVIIFGVYRILIHFSTSKLNFPTVGSAGDPDFFNAVLEGFEKV